MSRSADSSFSCPHVCLRHSAGKQNPRQPGLSWPQKGSIPPQRFTWLHANRWAVSSVYNVKKRFRVLVASWLCKFGPCFLCGYGWRSQTFTALDERNRFCQRRSALSILHIEVEHGSSRRDTMLPIPRASCWAFKDRDLGKCHER